MTQDSARPNEVVRFLRVLFGGLLGAVLFAAWDHFAWASGPEFIVVIFQAITGRTLEPGMLPWVAWIAHAAVGTFLAAVFIYGQVYRFVPGPMWLRGVEFAGVIWIVSAVAGLPLVPLFLNISGSAVGPASASEMLATVSLASFVDVSIAHVIYGAVMGAVSGFGEVDIPGRLSSGAGQEARA